MDTYTLVGRLGDDSRFGPDEVPAADVHTVARTRIAGGGEAIVLRGGREVARYTDGGTGVRWWDDEQAVSSRV